MTCSYWVWIRDEADADLGAGFFITRRYILTAAHCLDRISSKLGARVSVELANGSTISAEVVELNVDEDLALLDVPHRQANAAGVVVPVTDVPLRDRAWWGPVRPPGSADPHLTGIVAEAPIPYVLSGGTQVEAAQLTTDVEIGDFSGYSGGPVEARISGEGPPRIIGLLVEQYLDRHDNERATNVLFATTIQHIITAFSCLDGGGPGRQSQLQVPATRAPSDPSAQGTRSRDLPAHALRRQFDFLSSWYEDGIIEYEEFAQLRLQVAKSVLMQAMKDVR